MKGSGSKHSTECIIGINGRPSQEHLRKREAQLMSSAKVLFLHHLKQKKKKKSTYQNHNSCPCFFFGYLKNLCENLIHQLLFLSQLKKWLITYL
ncbi:hypothetical protein OPV22_034579 [Ensete ventricosum]|uniref:Uncharacterized protein n=1 Tax=Ensete ventricosum TaxID=4639 RepID=A0AAV8PXR1_ENSVE|nr:hypothetical protein OPV22_034579 [Ensete ventricosum]